MKLLKQSTAASVIVGQLLDANGAAVTTGVVGDFGIGKNGSYATLSGATVTHIGNGYYSIALTTGNTDTVGRLVLYAVNTSYGMATHHWTVLLASVFDAIVTNATNTTGGLATATAAISAFAGAISTYAGGAVASVTAAVTVGTNNDKTGYSLSSSQTFSTTGSVGSVTGAVGSVTGAVGSVTGAVGSVTARVTANVDQWNAVTVTGMPMPTYTQPTGFLAATFPATVSSLTAAGVRTELSTELGRIDAAVSSRMATYTQPTGFLAATFPATVSSYAGGAVASVTGNVGGNVVGSVGSISGVTFPTHFNDLEISANGHVSAVVQSIANNSITASSIQGGAITAAKFAAGAIDANALAADAVTEIQNGLATAANLLIVSDRVSYSLAVLVGACSDAQTAAETYTLSIGGNTFTVEYSGLDASGNRSTTTLSKA